jgi:hypothetical protein
MNSIVRTGIISAEPISLTSMKNWLRVPLSVTNDDTDIGDLITEARQHCELLTNCALVRSTFVQYLDHFPGHLSHEGSGYSPGGIARGSGYDGSGNDRNHRWHGEIKLKRPPLVSVQDIWFIGTDGRPRTLNPGQDFVVDVASQPGRIRPIPYTVWPLTLHVPAAVAIRFTAGYAPNSDGVSAGQTAILEPEADTSALNLTWQPSKTVLQYAFQVDENNNIWIQTTNPSGVTGSGARPAFEAQAIGGTIASDGTANWLNVGPLRGFWTPGTPYAGQQQYVILDFNSNLQLLNVAALISQTIAPYSLQNTNAPPLPWSATLGVLTADNAVASAWRCLGPYSGLGNTGLTVPNSPEQQAGVLVDWTLPKTVTRAIKVLVTHWYFNREPVTPGTVNKVPLHVEDMLGGVTIHDFSPTP